MSGPGKYLIGRLSNGAADGSGRVKGITLAEGFVLAVGAVLLFAHLAGVLEFAFWTLVGLVALCVGFTVGWLWIVVFRPLRINALVARQATASTQYIGAPQQQPMFAAPPAAIPQTVNNTLGLPANLSGDETIRVLREMRSDR